MKEKNLKAKLEAVHYNATEMMNAIKEELNKDMQYDNMVVIMIIDGNDTCLVGYLSHIEVDESTLSLSNFRQFKDGIISESRLRVSIINGELDAALSDEEIGNVGLFDISLELYNEASQLYISSHLTKVYRDPLGRLTLSNEVNKNLEI